jgi:hypothetical protein
VNHQDEIKGDFGRFEVMLRIVSSVVAVAAILAIPVSQADARSSSGMRMSSPMGSMSRSHFSSGPRVGNFSSIRSGSVIGTRRVVIGSHRIHHRRFPFFVGVGAYGLYDTCWRWVPSVYGYRRVWVCDPYGYY